MIVFVLIPRFDFALIGKVPFLQLIFSHVWGKHTLLYWNFLDAGTGTCLVVIPGPF